MRTKEETESRIKELEQMRLGVIGNIYTLKQQIKSLKANLHALNGAINEATESMKGGD